MLVQIGLCISLLRACKDTHSETAVLKAFFTQVQIHTADEENKKKNNYRYEKEGDKVEEGREMD